MFKQARFFLYLSLILINFGFSKEQDPPDVKKLSEAIGHIIGKNLEEFGLELDLKRIIKGIKKASLNKSSPMSENECLEALAKLQFKANEKTSEKNLLIAEEFLKNNSKNQDIIEIEKEKIQYKIVKEGKGESLRNYNNPIVKITGKYFDGQTFSDVEEVLNISETLPSLQKAIIGMKLNEKREIYIHPELAFGKNPPSFNSLVIFDIEVLQLDTKENPLDEIAKKEKVF
jgi:peptidylprolyl isomerase